MVVASKYSKGEKDVHFGQTPLPLSEFVHFWLPPPLLTLDVLYGSLLWNSAYGTEKRIVGYGLVVI